MSFENLNASTFYVTTMGENQAPARQLLTKCRARIFSLVGDSQRKGVQEFLPPEWAKCGCVSGSWAFEVNQLIGWTSTRASQIPPSFALPLRGSPGQTKPKKDLSQKSTSTHARPNRYDCRGSSQPHRLLMCIFFTPCITGVLVLVLDLT